jgi:hypothetical protein
MSWGYVGSSAVNGGYSAVAVGTTGPAIKVANGILSAGSLSGSFGLSIAGIVVVSDTAGNVNLKWAQNTADAGELKMLTNSLLLLTKLA